MRPAAITIFLLAAAGCSSQQLYDNAQGWRENECSKILDTQRRERCMKEARQSHQEYNRR